MKKLRTICSMLIENNEHTESIKQIFLELGYDIEFKPDIASYLKESEDLPDLILLEPSLYHWEWLEVLIKFKADAPKVPVILFSSVTTAENGFTPLLGDKRIFLCNDVKILRQNLQQLFNRKIIPEKKILFVDDDVNVLSSYGRMLRKSAWQILKASSGEQALDIIQKEDIDLVVTDIKMPQMHGLELISEIRKENRELPIVVSSAYPGMKDDDELKFHEIAAFVEKPVDSDALQNTLGELLK